MSYLLTHVIWRENSDRCVTIWKYRILLNFSKTFDRSNANKNTGQKTWRINLCFKHFQLIPNENICVSLKQINNLFFSLRLVVVVVVVVVVVCIFSDLALPNISG